MKGNADSDSTLEKYAFWLNPELLYIDFSLNVSNHRSRFSFFLELILPFLSTDQDLLGQKKKSDKMRIRKTSTSTNSCEKIINPWL